MNQETKEKLNYCHVCNKFFFSEESLRLHLESETHKRELRNRRNE